MPSQLTQLPEAPVGLALTQAQVEANAHARQTITDQVMAQVVTLIEAFHQWYDDLAVRRLGQQVSQVVQAGQRSIAAQESGYMAWVLSSQSDTLTRPAGQIAVTDLRKGVAPDEVYQRLAAQMRYQRSIGDPYEKALKDVTDRARTMVDTDISLAARAQDQKSLQATHLAVGYRRVVHPELAEGGSCGMCIAASTRTYRTDALLPIHANCHCTVLPIMRGGDDPGHSLNNLSLSSLYGDANGTQAEALKRTRYQIDDHGELGAILTPGGNYMAKVSDAGLQSRIDDWTKRPGSRFRTSHLNQLRAEQRRRTRASRRH